MLSHLDTYMTAIALRTVKLPKMTWNPEMTVLNYEGVGLRLARVNEGLRRAIEALSLADLGGIHETLESLADDGVRARRRA